MKKIAAALGILVAVVGSAFADSTTSRLGITKPSIGSPGWGTKTNANWDVIDSTVPGLAAENTFTGPNTFAGQTTVDGASVTIKGGGIVISSDTFGIQWPDGSRSTSAVQGGSGITEFKSDTSPEAGGHVDMSTFAFVSSSGVLTFFQIDSSGTATFYGTLNLQGVNQAGTLTLEDAYDDTLEMVLKFGSTDTTRGQGPRFELPEGHMLKVFGGANTDYVAISSQGVIVPVRSTSTLVTPEAGQVLVFVDEDDGVLKLMDESGAIANVFDAGLVNHWTINGGYLQQVTADKTVRMFTPPNGETLRLDSTFPTPATTLRFSSGAATTDATETNIYTLAVPTGTVATIKGSIVGKSATHYFVNDVSYQVACPTGTEIFFADRSETALESDAALGVRMSTTTNSVSLKVAGLSGQNMWWDASLWTHSITTGTDVSEGGGSGSTFMEDSFTGTTGTNLQDHVSPEDGTTWTEHASFTTGNATLSTNRVRSSDANTAGYYASAVPPSADYYVEANMYVAGTSNNAVPMGITGRMSTSANTMYKLKYQIGSSAWVLQKIVSGSVTDLGSWSNSLTTGQSRKAKLLMVGDQISAYVADTLVIGPVTDSSITAAGRPGIHGVTQTSGSMMIDDIVAVTQ